MKTHRSSVWLNFAGALAVAVMTLGGNPIRMAAQEATQSPGASVPTVVQFGGVLLDESGKPLSGTVGVTFLLYKDQQGGAPLWLETQNVQPDRAGRFSVMLGSTSSSGLPNDIFVAGEARWLAVQAQGQPEQPRVMLLSVPYALKAGDAETLGGLPVSAFALVSSNAGGATSGVTNGAASPASTASALSTSSNVTTTGGTVNALPLWTTATNIQSSALTQAGTGSTAKVGINTTTPSTTLDVKGAGTIRGALSVLGAASLPATGTATSSGGKNSQPLNLTASAFSSGTNAAVNETFQWQAEPANNDTSNPSGTLNLLFGSGTSKPAETGLNVASNGLITFAKGQTFPGTGTGTITGVTAGTGLLGGGTSGSVTLNLDTTKVPELNTGNTFTGNQIVNGNLSSTGVVTGSGYQIGSNLFAYGLYSSGNAFLGFSGNTSMSGGENTASGWRALFSNTSGTSNTADGWSALTANTTGTYNTADGYLALESNATGSFNTASGQGALDLNTTGSSNTGFGSYAGHSADISSITGSNNTFVGSSSSMSTGTLNNSTAIGANAEVTASNAMVLGSIAGVNGATSSVNVGIGTTAPAYALDVHGTGNFTGLVTFAPSQTFPGTGTITGVTAGAGLTGGGTSGGVTVGLASNACSAGTALSALPFTCSPFATLGSNTYTGNQTVNGNVSATGLVSSAGFEIGSTLFDYGDSSNANSFLGFGGNLTMTGQANIAAGVNSLISNTTGGYNTAIGFYALNQNTTGSENTANGDFALYHNTTGSDNTASGGALGSNTTGSDNTASGHVALAGNTTGCCNTASGSQSLYLNSAGTGNAAQGYQALFWATGSNNTGLGTFAGNPTNAQATTGSNNTYVGYQTTSGVQLAVNNATAIGANAEVDQNNSLVLGSINGVNGATADTNVGIGTTAPQTLFHIDHAPPVGVGMDVAEISSGGSIDVASLLLKNTGSGGYRLRVGAGTGSGYLASSGPLVFITADTGSPSFPSAAAMTIDNSGNVNIRGNLSKGGGSFQIDHPLDPANKYLYHSFVESPDMMNVYNGNITTNKSGLAIVTLPDYFEALNRDFRYQLTVIGQFAQAIVAKEINHARFTIKTSKPGVKVSWQVTGIRQDVYANAHRIPVEEAKPQQERGHYLHPELFGASDELAIGTVPHGIATKEQRAAASLLVEEKH